MVVYSVIKEPAFVSDAIENECRGYEDCIILHSDWNSCSLGLNCQKHYEPPIVYFMMGILVIVVRSILDINLLGSECLSTLIDSPYANMLGYTIRNMCAKMRLHKFL